jgi:hypothetical protein
MYKENKEEMLVRTYLIYVIDLRHKLKLNIWTLTADFIETGAMPVPTKLRNPIIRRWGGPFHSYLDAEMAKTLRNGLIMSERDPLNHKWLDFAI